MLVKVVYLLCALASVFCAWLLVRNYRRTRMRLALWTCLCFVGLALNNLVLFVDLVVVPNINFGLWRSMIALTAVSVLLFGLIWEER
ncbi:MAG: DUF5985 family protein [Acidobacteriota bacterium]